MKKLLYILAIMLLFVPAVSLAQSSDAIPTAQPTVPPVVPPAIPPTLPVDPGTMPGSGLLLLDSAMKDLALAVNAHDAAEFDQYLAIAQQKLAAATAGMEGIDASLKAGVKCDRLKADLKIKVKYLDKTVLKIDAKVKENKEGLYKVDIKVKGDLTEQEQAYLAALADNAEALMPGVNVTLKINDHPKDPKKDPKEPKKDPKDPEKDPKGPGKDHPDKKAGKH